MTGRRTSARQAAKASSTPSLSHNDVSTSAGSKRKASSGAQSKQKRGKKSGNKEQTTIDQSMPNAQKEDTEDVEMKEKDDDSQPTNGAGAQNTGDKADKQADDDGSKTAEKIEAKTAPDTNGDATAKGDTEDAKPNGLEKIMKKDDEKDEAPVEGAGSNVAAKDNAVEESSKREEALPSSILEKGIIYFFFRGRVGIDEPNSVTDVARSYIVLRPIPPGAKLGAGPIGDAGANRILALPKKVLPVSGKDRFLTYVEKAKSSMNDIKDQFSSSEYATKTAGTRHTPAAAPIGEGVYAITQTGGSTHLAYILTLPEELDDVQKGIGLRQRGSFTTSAKNPQSSAPANAQLPQGADYPKEILDEFRGRGWMPLQPKLLDYEFTQFLIIGHGEGSLEKATQPQDGEDQKDEKETPMEEMEKLEREDESRVKGLDGDHAVFVDLGFSSKEYPKMQTTW